jgi:O-antigen ligase
VDKKVIVKQHRPTFSAKFWVTAAFVATVFILGGASRSDVQSLTILRPLSVLICGFAIFTIDRSHIRGRTWTLLGLLAIFALTSLHLLPMPISVHLFSGRDLVNEVNITAGLGDIWHPISLAPISGLDALFTLMIPLGITLLCIQLTRDELYRLLPVMIGIGTISGIFGVLQAAGDPQGPFYLYRITNNGVAVGLFANRNHAALLLACLFPMLAVFASKAGQTDNERRVVPLICGAIGIVLIPLILVTGSRSGVFLAIFGLLGATALYRPTTERGKNKSKFALGGRKRNAPYLFLGILVVCLSLLTLLFSRAQAIERLFQQSVSDEARIDFWIVSLKMFWNYFPLGTGSASFAQAFQVDQPSSLLNPTYLNRAHNDWLEIVTDFGLLGAAFLVAAAGLFVRITYRLWFHYSGIKRSISYARMATVLIAMIGFASFGDYPLRTPAFMGLAVILMLWLGDEGRNLKQSDKV